MKLEILDPKWGMVRVQTAHVSFPTTDLIGQKIGEYDITSKLGVGGMGVVYEGRHPLIGKRVAVKVLLPSLSNETELVERFLSEARAVNEIRHRGIVDIFSFGTLPDGSHYFVMEYLEGHPFDRVIKSRAPVSPGETLQWLDEMLDALEAAHASGIVHRDIKPSNLFLVDTGRGRPYVKLLDFGIAKLGAFEGQAAAQTRASVIVGTPDYLAPEQARGKPISVQTDLYSLGVVAFEMLTGQRPFRGENALQTMWMHVENEPERPSALHSAVPSDVDDLVLWAMQKEPANRPKNAAEMRSHVLTLRSKYSAEPYTRVPVSSRGAPLYTPSPTSNKGLPRPPTPAPRSQKSSSGPASKSKSGPVSLEGKGASKADAPPKPEQSKGTDKRISETRLAVPKATPEAVGNETIQIDSGRNQALRPKPVETLDEVQPKAASKAPLIAAVGALIVLGGIGLYFATRTPDPLPPLPSPELVTAQAKVNTPTPEPTLNTKTPEPPTKPVDAKPVDAKPVDAKPVDAKPVNDKPPVNSLPKPDPKPEPPPAVASVIPPVKATKPDAVKPEPKPSPAPPKNVLSQAQLEGRLSKLKSKLSKIEEKAGGPDRILRQFMQKADAQVSGAGTDAQRKAAWKYLDGLEAQLGGG
jgi:serine/threonine protein kinase